MLPKGYLSGDWPMAWKVRTTKQYFQMPCLAKARFRFVRRVRWPWWGAGARASHDLGARATACGDVDARLLAL